MSGLADQDRWLLAVAAVVAPARAPGLLSRVATGDPAALLERATLCASAPRSERLAVLSAVIGEIRGRRQGLALVASRERPATAALLERVHETLDCAREAGVGTPILLRLLLERLGG